MKSGEGNLHQGIDKVLSLFQDGSVHALTLGMVGVSEYLFKYSNITMFTSFSDETLLKRIEETKKHISAAFKDSKGKAIEVESKTSDPRVKLKTKVPNLPIFGFEASIFKEDNYAPLWEELFYRFAPALMLTILISVTMMFAPAGFVLFTKIGFAVILTLFQTIFVKAHIVTDWLRAKDSGGEKSSEEAGISQVRYDIARPQHDCRSHGDKMHCCIRIKNRCQTIRFQNAPCHICDIVTHDTQQEIPIVKLYFSQLFPGPPPKDIAIDDHQYHGSQDPDD